MANDLRSEAERLAARPYTIEIQVDETAGGGEVFLLSHPELDGCMAQGAEIDEAFENLAEVAIEYIMSLLEDGVPVPQPAVRASPISTSGSSVEYQDTWSPEPGFMDILGKAAQPESRRHVGTISVIEERRVA